MDTINILNSSISWMGKADQKINFDFIPLRVKPATAQPEQAPDWNVSEVVAWSHYVDQELNQLCSQAARKEEGNAAGYLKLSLLTQVILNTLNSASERFHQLWELPGLENHSKRQLDQFSDYLSQQGWVEAKVMGPGLSVKLTMKGKLFAEQHNAWV